MMLCLDWFKMERMSMSQRNGAEHLWKKPFDMLT